MDMKGGSHMYKFKGYCAENGIRQKEIADLLGLSISNVNSKLNGHLEWTLEQVKTLCQYYGISADIYFV